MAINQDSEQGKALQAVIQGKLKETDFLGPDYADTVLPLYITVMLAHNNMQQTVADSLKAFLGAEKAPLFSSWLFAFLAEHRSEYVVAPEDIAAKQASNSGGSTTTSPGDSQIHADTPEQRLMQPADNGAQAQAMGEAGELPANSGHLHGATWSPIRHPSSLEEPHRHRERDRPRSSARTPEPEPIRRLQQQLEEGQHDHFRDGRRHDFRGSDQDRGFFAPGDLGRKGSGGRYSPLRDRRHMWHTERRQELHADWQRRPSAYQEQRAIRRRSCSPAALRQQYHSPPHRTMYHPPDSPRQMFGRSAPTRQQQTGPPHRHPCDHQMPVRPLPRSLQQPQRGGQSPPQQLGFDVRRLQPGSQEHLRTRAQGLQSGAEGPPRATQADLLSNRVLQMDIAKQERCREQQLRQQQRLQEEQRRLMSLEERWQHDGAGVLPFSPVQQVTLQEAARRQDAAARDSADPPTQSQGSQPAALAARPANGGVQHRLGRQHQNGGPRRSRLFGRLGHRRLPERPCQLFESAVRQAIVPAGPTTKGSAAHMTPGQQEGGSSVFDRLHIQAASGDVAANATAAMVLQQLGHYIRQAAPGPVTPQALPAEIDEVKAKLRQMELEVTRLKAEQRTVQSGAAAVSATAGAASTNARSVVVHNVHFGATAEVVAAHFAQCGGVQRVTVLHDKATGKLKGMAYVEFTTLEGAANAQSLQDSLLMQRPIVVVPKQPKTVRLPQRLHQRACSFPLGPPPHQVHMWHSGSASKGIQKRQRVTSSGPGRTNKYVRPTPPKQASLEGAALQIARISSRSSVQTLHGSQSMP